MEMNQSHFHYHPSSPPGEDQLLPETMEVLATPGTMLEDIQMTNRQSSYISYLLVDQVIEMIRAG
jgi:hypothetical protein